MDEKKLEIMKMVVSGEKSIAWASAKLRRSEKTIRRYKNELEENPNATLVHKNRERESVNKTDHEQIWSLYQKKYYGINMTYFCEKLEKNENIKISEGLVRLIFKEHDEFSVKAWHRTKNELRKRLRELKKLSKKQKEVLVQLETEPYVKTTHPTQSRYRQIPNKPRSRTIKKRVFAPTKRRTAVNVLDIGTVYLAPEKGINVLRLSM